MSADLFSLLDEDERSDLTPPTPTADTETLDRYAFLYTATDKGHATGIKSMATREDAIRWCSSPVSRGMIHGSHWAYFWTSVLNFVRHHTGDAEIYGEHAYQLNLNGLVDNGEWDERIAAAGCKMIKHHEIAAVLEPLGVTVHGTPKVKRRRQAA